MKSSWPYVLRSAPLSCTHMAFGLGPKNKYEPTPARVELKMSSSFLCLTGIWVLIQSGGLAIMNLVLFNQALLGEMASEVRN